MKWVKLIILVKMSKDIDVVRKICILDKLQPSKIKGIKIQSTYNFVMIDLAMIRNMLLMLQKLKKN